ncbi:nucleotidyltransferase domain-containing protein [Bacillus sp. CHD6a]|uniref:nucleotidyltransferase domain-containing protein n=1 Tax=Bacillus sp. CHD6a TaxID=1643452 RepID=UPI000A5F4261|nr:nucleotidyltransferase domain-containing protein [Bacillus sp. CHD6a]
MPTEREKLREAIYKDLVQDTKILAFFYGGSLAKGNADLYSDLDLRIVVEDSAYETYRLNKKERATNWGDVLYYEDFPWASYSIAHFRSFIKVDTFYYRQSDLHPSPYLKYLLIEHDPNGIISQLRDKSQSIDYPFSEEEFEVWRGKFFAYLHEVYRRVQRGEYLYAFQMVHSLSYSIVIGWYVEAGEVPNSFGDWSKVEGPRSPLSLQQLSLLKQWDTGKRDAKELFSIARSQTEEFIRIQGVLAERVGSPVNQDLLHEIMDMVL